MTHPYGKHWEQPPSAAILLDDTYALMTQLSFEALHDYSATTPSGVYEGKMWRRHDGIFAAGFPPSAAQRASAKWLLCWYGPSEKPDCCSINYREILLV
jgi:hypothetical protein